MATDSPDTMEPLSIPALIFFFFQIKTGRSNMNVSPFVDKAELEHSPS